MKNKHFGISVRFLCLLSFVSYFGGISAQVGKPIECSANLLQYDAGLMDGTQIFTGNVEFRHEGSTGYADTVFYHQRQNVIEAFGRELIIHINDSVHLYGRYLVYDGKSRIAVLRGDVMLMNNQGVLYTDCMTYFRDEQYAMYDQGGRLENDSAVLTSRYARYYTNTNDVYFRKNVSIQHPDFSLSADTLRYNTCSETAYFLGPTTMQSSDGDVILCENGWFATKTEDAEFYENTCIYTDGKEISADTMHYNNLSDYGFARSNICMLDTAEGNFVKGNYLQYYGREKCVYLTDSAVVVYIQDKDSVFLHADTLKVLLDSDKCVETVEAFANVRFFGNKRQGRCDLLVYNSGDSMVQLFNTPVVWMDSNQIFADTISVFFKNSQISEVHLLQNAFVSQNLLFEKHFNQIKGDKMFVYFKDGEMNHMTVRPDAMCLYYILEEDSSLTGVYTASADSMKILFEDNEFSTITFYNRVKGDFGPEGIEEKRNLPNFMWLRKFCPKNRNDIFVPDNLVVEKAEKDE